MSGAPYHAHVYYDLDDRDIAAELRDRFVAMRDANAAEIRFVGRMVDRPIGPHPMPQYEVHFDEGGIDGVRAAIKAAGVRALIHPLTLDDLADHTTLGQWIGEPLDLDISVLDPPGINQGVPRYGKSDF